MTTSSPPPPTLPPPTSDRTHPSNSLQPQPTSLIEPHPPSPSSIIDSLGSPRSILSWNNLTDLISTSDSSSSIHVSSTSPSLKSDDHLSDLEIDPPIMTTSTHQSTDHHPEHDPFDDGRHRPFDPTIHSNLQAHHHLNPDQSNNPELLAAITRHLVMPRLPMIPSPSTQSSRPTSLRSRNSRAQSSSSLHHPLDLAKNHPHPMSHSDPSTSGSQTHSSSPSTHQSRILIIDNTEVDRGAGSLNIHPSSFTHRLHRIGDLLPQFRFSDPMTYPNLIDFIEGPLNRLKEILNPMIWDTGDQYSLPLTIQADLINLVDYWIERESYLLLLVEIESFPLPPDQLEFILLLSRLIPIIPYIPSIVPIPRAVHGHAILKRQFIAKRIQHFPIPHPESISQGSIEIPSRDECLRQSSRCTLDWLAVEFASTTHHYPHPSILKRQDESIASKSQNQWDIHELNRKLQDLEPDRWSEKISQRIIQRNKTSGKIRSDVLGQFKFGSPAVGNSSQIIHRNTTTTTSIKDRGQQSCLTIEALGLPSLRILIRLGIQEFKQNLMKFLIKSFGYRSSMVIMSVKEEENLKPNHRSFNSSTKSTNCTSTSCSPSSTQNLKHHHHHHHHYRHHHRRHQSEPSSDQSSQIHLDNSSKSIIPTPSFKDSKNSKNKRTSATTTWFMIGFFTATTAAAAFTVWWKNHLLFL